MQLAEISIRRPVFATVLSLLILLIGAVSFNRLTVREYPKIDEPVVTVSVRYLGASAEVIETQVTKPLEDSIAGIDGVDVITSISRADQAQISVRFRLEKDADSAAAEKNGAGASPAAAAAPAAAQASSAAAACAPAKAENVVAKAPSQPALAGPNPCGVVISEAPSMVVPVRNISSPERSPATPPARDPA